MSLTVIRYGRYTSGAPESDTANLAANASHACVFNAATDNLWIYKAGFVGGKQAGDVSARISAYLANASKNPATRVGYMSLVAVTTIMVGGGDGVHYTALTSGSDNGPTNTAFMVYDGSRYAVDILSKNNAMRHSMVPASAITADNEQFYLRTAPGDPPPSSYGAYSASTEGHITTYLEGYLNTPPMPCSTSIYPTGTISETAPIFTADFRDLCGAYGASSGLGVDLGDRVNQYKFQLRQVGTTTLLWSSSTIYNATGAEKTAPDQISRAYGGSALTRGVSYEWRIACSDEFGEWGSYSDTGSGTGWFVFTPAALGFITLDDVPTGKQESNVPDFKGRWNHQTAVTMKRVQVQLRAANGITVLQTGADYDIADVASSALPGTLFTVTWANTGLSTLSWATSYTYAMRGYDGTQWSDYSAVRSFTTNAAPSIPSGLTPSGGTIFTGTAYPLLQATFTDADDTTATGLTGVFRVTRPDLSTVDVTPTYNATTLKWEYQTTAVQITMVGTYSWKATGFDGTLYSGSATVLGSATFSSSKTFVYATGPTVTVTSPANGAVLTSSSLPVAWTCSTPQTKWQVTVYADGDTGTIIYDSLLQTSTAANMVIPAGYLRNGVAYDLIVHLVDSTPLDGYSAIVNISLSVTPPTAVANVAAVPTSIGIDPFDTAIAVSWEQTGYSVPEFAQYLLYRTASGGPDTAAIILARLTAPGQVNFTDYTPASGYTYTYGVSVVTNSGADQVESAVTEASALVTLAGTVLTLLGNGGSYRANLLNIRERKHSRKIAESVYLALDAEAPVTVRTPARYWEGAYTTAIVSNSTATAEQRFAELDALDQAAHNGVACIRDSRGRKRFVKITDLEPGDEMTDWYSVNFKVRQEKASEGVT